MRRFLAIFGILTVTISSVGFLSNAFLANKNVISKKIDSKDILLNPKDLTEERITEIDKESQSWNNEKIDETLKYGLQYHNNQLIIDKKKLDMKKLPTEVANHLNLALYHLNNAVNNGNIKVAVNNNEVQLIYPNPITTFNSLDTNSDIIYFDSKPTLTNFHASYMWYTSYGPSHWWKFWEWGGGYIHFNETAVYVAKWVHLLALIANIVFLFKNIIEIEKIVGELKIAHNLGDTIKINSGLKQLSKIFGGIDLNLLGEIVDILAIFTALASFVISLTSMTGWGLPIIELISSLFASVTGQMINTDKGKGVKWKWPCFIIPGKISAE